MSNCHIYNNLNGTYVYIMVEVYCCYLVCVCVCACACACACVHSLAWSVYYDEIVEGLNVTLI
jgi:hypothetical protein